MNLAGSLSVTLRISLRPVLLLTHAHAEDVDGLLLAYHGGGCDGVAEDTGGVEDASSAEQRRVRPDFQAGVCFLRFCRCWGREAEKRTRPQNNKARHGRHGFRGERGECG